MRFCVWPKITLARQMLFHSDVCGQASLEALAEHKVIISKEGITCVTRDNT